MALPNELRKLELNVTAFSFYEKKGACSGSNLMYACVLARNRASILGGSASLVLRKPTGVRRAHRELVSPAPARTRAPSVPQTEGLLRDGGRPVCAHTDIGVLDGSLGQLVARRGYLLRKAADAGVTHAERYISAGYQYSFDTCL